MRRTLRLRLALTHTAVALLAVAVVAVIVFVAGDRRFDRYLSEVQRTRDEAVLRSLTDTYRKPDGWDASSIYALSQVAILGNVDVAVYSVEEQLLFTVQRRDVDRGASGIGTATGGEAESEPGPPASAEPSGVVAAEDQFDVQRYPIVAEGQRVATAELYTPLNARTAAEKDYQRALTGDLVVGVVAAAILAFLVSLVVSRRVTGPLEELTDAAQEVSKGNLDIRVAPHTEDEVGALAVAFNSMAGRLAQNEEWRRDMSSDLAHELQAPLATIRFRIQTLEDGGFPATPEDLRVIREGVEHLGRLLAALRSLSELESEDLDITYEELDLADIGREAMAQAQSLFEARDVDLAADLAPARVKADRDRLVQVVASLLDNALKHTPSGGRVAVSVSSGESPAELPVDDRLWARLSVIDSGPSIESVDLPFVFDRFYRGNPSRSTHGVGLGLTTVRGLAEAQGGMVAAANQEGGGVAFTVYLPLAG